jgi:hypothetical protein
MKKGSDGSEQAFRWQVRHGRGLTVNSPHAKIMEIRYNYQYVKFSLAGSYLP